MISGSLGYYNWNKKESYGLVGSIGSILVFDFLFSYGTDLLMICSEILYKSTFKFCYEDIS